jgi:predicted MFS family arabinose efflux permease
VTIWFPQRLWATGNSLVLGVGSLGVIVSTSPLQAALAFITWREVFFAVAAVCAALIAGLVFAVPERALPDPGSARSSASIYRDVLTAPLFWRLMPISCLSMGTFFAMQGLWANAWMADVGGLAQGQIGVRLLVMAIAMSTGMLLNGSIGDRLSSFGIPLSAVMAAGVAALFVAELAMILEWQPDAWWPWFVMGYTGNIGALAYPQISRRFPASSAARAMSALTVANFGLAFAIQFAFGVIVDQWAPDAAGHYPAAAYRVALSLFLALQAIAFVWFVTSRDVWGRPERERKPSQPHVETGHA